MWYECKWTKHIGCVPKNIGNRPVAGVILTIAKEKYSIVSVHFRSYPIQHENYRTSQGFTNTFNYFWCCYFYSIVICLDIEKLTVKHESVSIIKITFIIKVLDRNSKYAVIHNLKIKIEACKILKPEKKSTVFD